MSHNQIHITVNARHIETGELAEHVCYTLKEALTLINMVNETVHYTENSIYVNGNPVSYDELDRWFTILEYRGS